MILEEQGAQSVHKKGKKAVKASKSDSKKKDKEKDRDGKKAGSGKKPIV